MVTLCGFFDTADPSSDVAAAAAVVAGAAVDNLSAAVEAWATGAVVAAADEFSAAVVSAASDFSARAAPAFMSPAASTYRDEDDPICPSQFASSVSPSFDFYGFISLFRLRRLTLKLCLFVLPTEARG
jgi:hypothetical protein